MREGVVPPGDKTSSRLEDRTFVFDDEQFVREDPWKVFDIEIAASSFSLSLVTYVLLWKFMRGLSMYVRNCIINQSVEFVMKNAKRSTDELTTANRMKSDYHTFLCESAMKLGRTYHPPSKSYRHSTPC